jgi:hypothetical protein
MGRVSADGVFLFQGVEAGLVDQALGLGEGREQPAHLLDGAWM